MNWRTLYFALAGMICYSQFLAAQDKSKIYTDSLLNTAYRASSDSNSVKAFTQLQRHFYEKGNFDSTLKYAKLALPIVNRMESQKTLSQLWYRLGMTYTNLQIYDSAAYYLEKTLNSATIARDTLQLVNCLDAFATLRSYQTDYAASVEYSLQAIMLIDQSRVIKIKNLLPQNYSRVAYNFVNEKQYAKAIDYGKKGLILRGYSSEGRHRTMLFLTVFFAYLEIGDLKTSKIYLDSAIRLSSLIDNEVIDAMVANNEGLYYQKIDDRERAYVAYLKSYQLNKNGNHRLLQSEAGDNLANILFKKENYILSEKYALESNSIGRELKLYHVVASTFAVLKSLSARKADFKKALFYAEQNKIYADSAINQETQNITLTLESKYQHQKSEREIASLTAANIKNELEVTRRNQLLVIVGIGATSALIILGLFYRNSRQMHLLAEQQKKYQQEQIKFLEGQQQVVSLQSMAGALIRWKKMKKTMRGLPLSKVG